MGDILLEVIPSNYPSGDSHKASFVTMNGVCAMQNKCVCGSLSKFPLVARSIAAYPGSKCATQEQGPLPINVQ